MMAAVMAMHAIGIDIMLPALPAMAHSLHIPHVNQRQLIITAYVMGFAVTQIIFGPLSDRYGRKPVLLTGLCLYATTALIASMAMSFELMLAARLMQGMAASAGRILSISIIRDRYAGPQMARMMSTISVIFMAAPILAPSIGQIIVIFAQWRGVFFFMAGTAFAVALWISMRLPETLDPDHRRPFTLGHIGPAIVTVVSNRISLGYALGVALTYGSQMGYINSAQQIFTDALGAGKWFAPLFAIPVAAFMISAFINSRIVEALGSRMVSHSALIGIMAMTGIHALWALTIGDTVVSFTVFQFLTFLFLGCVSSNFNAMAMEPMGKVAGTASSVHGTISTLGSGIVGLIIGQSFDGTVVPVIAGFFCCALGALIVVLVAERGQLFGRR